MKSLPPDGRSRTVAKWLLIAIPVVVLASSVKIADYIIEYNWWKEMGQVHTWLTTLSYAVLPVAIGTALAFLALWASHSRGLRFAGVQLPNYGLYSVLVACGLFIISIIVSLASMDSWTVMRYVGSFGSPAGDSWKDPVFSHPLGFYLFDVPFYQDVLGYLFAVWVLALIVFWLTARGWQLADRIRWALEAEPKRTIQLDGSMLLLPGATRSNYIRLMAAVLLLLIAAQVVLGNYDLLLNPHAFMTGADYVDQRVTLPLRWLLVLISVAAIPLVWSGRYVAAVAAVAAGAALLFVAPAAISVLYVRPNEISIERPFIQRHLEATSAAFGLERRATTRAFPVSDRETIGNAPQSTLLQNIRLWDWRAYTDTITQIQALRPYYTFADTDVDRYTIDGQIKQVLISPRELDVRQLPPDARESWVNPNLVYTHGFGVVMSDINKTTADGLPDLLIENAPPEIKLPQFRLTRPEIYYGESTHDPVFVNTVQEEFDYPSGDQNKYSRYQGDGGFPVGSLFAQAAAALSFGDSNILFTRYFTAQSRMMIHRNVRERLQHLAGFLTWDADPYLVITDDGRLVWMVDGYTTSELYPYSATLPVAGLSDGANYIRNAVKATVDAYTGKTSLYVFDPEDPIVLVYERLFPELFKPAAEMPADLRRHARYPEGLFAAQAEAYRIFHMRDPQVFYNKEDVWQIAGDLYEQSGKAEPMSPTYVVATLPGETNPEFLLMLPFTPRGKDNLIGWMAARCDGDHLNELVYFELSKQQLVYGPMQIESRIDQDQNISRDLTLWNQQGSRVRRGNLLALPLADSFLYVEPIYIQATEARMPQLKKVVLALGNRLVYRDTFEEALADLTQSSATAQPAQPQALPAPAAGTELPADLAQRLRDLRGQTQKLLDEIDAIEKETGKK